MMEVLNDYVAVNYFGIKTFSVGIFKYWFSMDDKASAIILSLFLLLIVILLIIVSKIIRKNDDKIKNHIKASPSIHKNTFHSSHVRNIPTFNISIEFCIRKANK